MQVIKQYIQHTENDNLTNFADITADIGCNFQTDSAAAHQQRKASAKIPVRAMFVIYLHHFQLLKFDNWYFLSSPPVIINPRLQIIREVGGAHECVPAYQPSAPHQIRRCARLLWTREENAPIWHMSDLETEVETDRGDCTARMSKWTVTRFISH